ncbi:P-loop containing nucleoside triphosphate hydrolase protein, partial [Periconia macrospinosa]
MVAARIAEELDVELGRDVVGLRYRGCNLATEKTRLAILTDGLLLAFTKRDHNLTGFGVIIIDEAHQHSVATDLLLGFLKSLIKKRDDIKIIIMSATMDTQLFKEYFENAAVETVSGREYGVDIFYLPGPPENETDVLVNTIIQVHALGAPGDILVFVAGADEVHKVTKLVKQKLADCGNDVLGPIASFPLYAQLPLDDQNEAVESVPPPGGRKLIVATNFAETSVTFVGVQHVIDSCREKQNVWNPRTRLWHLVKVWVSKAVANQRAGRAGRTDRGFCWRMVTQPGFHKLLDQSVAQMQMSDMVDESLHILSMNQHPIGFRYIKAPAAETVCEALGVLNHLGAISRAGNLTEFGKLLSFFPTSVYQAYTLVKSQDHGCVAEVIIIVAMIEATEGTQVFLTSPDDDHETHKEIEAAKNYFRHPSGDHLTLFNIYMAWRQAHNDREQDQFVAKYHLRANVLAAADTARDQFMEVFFKNSNILKLSYLPENQPRYYLTILTALAAGNFLRVAKRLPDSKTAYETVRGRNIVSLSNKTKLSPPNDWVFYNEVYQSSSTTGLTMRIVSHIIPEFMVSANTAYWSGVELLREGHIKDELANIFAKMTK